MFDTSVKPNDPLAARGVVAMLKKLVKEAMRMIGFRVSHAEYAAIEAKARQFTGGNVSEWVRYAAIHMEPKPQELV